MLIREAALDERKNLAALALQAYDEYRTQSSPEFWSRYKKNIEIAFLEDERPVRLIAMLESELVGCVLLFPAHKGQEGDPRPHSDYPEMRLLAVSPAARNAGVGRALIEECEKRAREQGAPAITLHTTHLMSVAKAMYERSHYERFPSIDFEPVPGFLVMGFKKDLQVSAVASAGPVSS